MKKLLIISLLIFILTSCFNNTEKPLSGTISNSHEKEAATEKENNKKIEDKKIEDKKIIIQEFNKETQTLINKQMEKGPQVILDVNCDKDYKTEQTIKYCKEEQVRVKKLFKITE